MISIITQIYNYLNKELFAGSLSSPQIQYRMNRKYAMRWESETNILHIGADFIDLNLINTGIFLIHEMVHILNKNKNIVDVSANQYHKLEFASVAANLGFYVLRHKTQGWSITQTNIPSSLKEDHIDPVPEKLNKLIFVLKNIPVSVKNFEKQMKNFIDLRNQSKPIKSFFLKYQCQCPPPYNSIRSGRRPDSPNAPEVFCKKCQSDFVCS